MVVFHQKPNFLIAKTVEKWWFSTIFIDFLKIGFFGGFPPKSMVDIHHVRPNHVNTLNPTGPMTGLGSDEIYGLIKQTRGPLNRPKKDKKKTFEFV